MAILCNKITHNELSCNNSKFKNLLKEIVKLFFSSIIRYIQVLFLLKFFNLSFLMTPLNKIPGATIVNKWSLKRFTQFQ